MELVNKLNEEWDQKSLENELAKIEDDIKAAKKQHKTLIERHKALEEEKNDLVFLCNEAKAKLDAYESQTETKLSRLDIPEPEEGSTPEEGTFFSIYTRLEDELTNTEGKLQAANAVRSDLKHKLTKLQQKNHALSHDHSLEEKKLLAESENIDDLTNESSHISALLTERKNSLTAVAETYESISKEVNTLEDKIRKIEEGDIAKLKENLRTLKSKYEVALRDERMKKALLEKKTRESIQIREAKQQEIDNVSSVKSWLAERSALLARIKNMKSQLLGEQQRKVSNERAIEEYNAKFEELLGDSDSRCERARMLAIAELESRADRPDPIAEANAAAEEDYKRGLEEQIETLRRSLSDLQQYRDRTLKELEIELAQASEDGYSKLLARELAEIQANLNRI